MKVLSAVAWPYANGPRHLGHVAGFGVPSDVFSRYMRMAGHDVLMVSGSDEHGTPILVLADQAQVTPRELPIPTEGGALTVDSAGVYTYAWKTLSQWAGTCREVVVTRDDGRQHRAFFRFQ